MILHLTRPNLLVINFDNIWKLTMQLCLKQWVMCLTKKSSAENLLNTQILKDKSAFLFVVMIDNNPYMSFYHVNFRFIFSSSNPLRFLQPGIIKWQFRMQASIGNDVNYQICVKLITFKSISVSVIRISQCTKLMFWRLAK